MLAALLAAALDLSAAAVVRDGRVVAVEALGVPREAVFRMASLSKVVTAYVVLQLVKERRVDLNADLATYLGDLPMKRHRGAKVTLHHLVTHTSGIEDAFFGNVVPVTGHIPSLDEHFRARPPTFGRPPGAQVLYSNEGMALAGLVIERVTALPFAEAVRRRVFEPLGMRSSSFAQPPPLRVVPSGAEREAMLQSPSGAMVSTAGDMAKLMIALLSEPVLYGMFAGDIGGRPGLFHTGRSGHESVLYLIPRERLGVFLVHTGGLDRTLRRRYVESIVGNGPPPPPRDVRIASGVYRPILLPQTRIEKFGELMADANATANGSRITVRMPPFARGQTLVFDRGASSDGYRIDGNADRFTITGPLFDPVTFVRIPWWASGIAQLGGFGIALLILLIAVLRARGKPRIAFALVLLFLLAAPVAFLAGYLPGDPETRPFRVASSARLAVTMLMCAAATCVITPFLARRHWIAGSLACLAIALALHHWNLIGYRF